MSDLDAISGHLDRLERSLRRLSVQLVDNNHELERGSPSAFICIFRALLLVLSPIASRKMRIRGCPGGTKTPDRTLLVSAFDFLRDEVKINPTITIDQFFSLHFIQQKLALVANLAEYIVRTDREVTVSPVSSPKYILYIDELRIEEVSNFGRPSKPSSIPTPSSLSVSLHPIPSSPSSSSSNSVSSYSSPYLSKSLNFSSTISSTSKIKEINPNIHSIQLNSPPSFSSSLDFNNYHSSSLSPSKTNLSKSLLPSSLPITSVNNYINKEEGEGDKQETHRENNKEEEKDILEDKLEDKVQIENNKINTNIIEKLKQLDKNNKKNENLTKNFLKSEENNDENFVSNYTIGYSDEILQNYTSSSNATSRNPLGVGNNPDGKFILSVTQDQLNKLIDQKVNERVQNELEKVIKSITERYDSIIHRFVGSIDDEMLILSNRVKSLESLILFHPASSELNIKDILKKNNNYYAYKDDKNDKEKGEKVEKGKFSNIK